MTAELKKLMYVSISAETIVSIMSGLLNVYVILYLFQFMDTTFRSGILMLTNVLSIGIYQCTLIDKFLALCEKYLLTLVTLACITCIIIALIIENHPLIAALVMPLTSGVWFRLISTVSNNLDNQVYLKDDRTIFSIKSNQWSIIGMCVGNLIAMLLGDLSPAGIRNLMLIDSIITYVVLLGICYYVRKTVRTIIAKEEL